MLHRRFEALEIRTLLSGTSVIENGDVVTLTTGLTADARIRAEEPNQNYGNSTTVRIDGPPETEAGLIRFDTSSIPVGSTILSVSLMVTVDNVSSDVFEIYELLRPWNESQVTFLRASNGASWQTAGAQGATDRGTTLLGTMSSPSAGSLTVELNAAGVAVVQSWIDNPGTNFGFIIQDFQNNSNKLAFRSRDDSNSGNQPCFVITYQLPPTNQPPIVDAGNDQSILLNESATLDGTVSDDSFPNPPGTLTTLWSVVSGPGTVTFADAASVDTTADFSEPGTYVLKLSADDGALVAEDQLTISVASPPVNGPPLAVDDAYSVSEGGTLDADDADGSAGGSSDDGVLANDTDPDGDPLSAILTSGPSFGSLTLNADGTFVYTHDGSQNFADSFTYRVNDGTVDGNTATVNITVTPVNMPPLVDAGVDGTILLSESAELDGTVTDDGRPDPPAAVTVLWSLFSGPGTVQFDDETDVDTSVSFSAPGIYFLQLTADDGEFSTSDMVRISVIEQSAVFTVSFQDGLQPTGGYQGTRDSEISSEQPTSNFGSDDDLDLDDSPQEAALVSWDISSIPFGSVVLSATITLNVQNPSADDYEIYQLLRPWLESEVTFNQPLQGESWEVAGVQGSSDRGTQVLGTISAPSPGLVTVTLNSAGIAVVQSWVDDPASNYGVLIQDYANASDRLELDSSESPVPASRPMLSVTYDAGAILDQNAPPVVAAGSDQTVFSNNVAILDGTVSDDNLPIPSFMVTTSWSVTSGPGAVTFADASSIDTIAEFSEPGTYVLRLTADDTQHASFDELTVTVVESSGQQNGVWISAEELMSLPTSGAAWETLLAAALSPAETPLIRDQGNDADVQVLAKALVGIRLNDVGLINEARSLIMAAIGTEIGGNTLALGKNLAGYVIAADIVGLESADEAVFRAWLEQTLVQPLSGNTLQSTHETKPNNWGTLTGASRAAVAAYLGDQEELTRVAQVFKGWLGDRSSYDGFSWTNDMSWHADSDAPVGINPVGSTKQGHSIDGALPDDMRRGDSFKWPAQETNYPWTALQGAVVQAEILFRAGFDAWQWEDQALLRAMQFLQSIGWQPVGNDEWIPWLIDARYSTNFATNSAADPGKIMAWTSWTHPHSGAPGSNAAPVVNAGPDFGTVTSSPTSLQATLYDDGWPEPPGQVSVTWSMVSGTGTVTFANPSAVNTTASFSQVGTYVLRVTANDGEHSAFDEVTVTVDIQPTNTPPQVDAGPGQTVFVFATASLFGTVIDDGWPVPPGVTTTQWSVVSGPGTVVITDTLAADTSVVFNEQGTYVLRLTANDGQIVVTDDVTFVVEASPVGELVAFQQGVSHGGLYAGTTDTTIESSSPNSNLGGAAEVEMDGRPDSASLIRWEIDPQLTGREVLAASITVYVTNLSPATFEIYELLDSWVESEATWNHYAAGVEWEVPGAQGESDRDNTVLATLRAPSKGFYTIQLNSAGVAVVQAWFDDPSRNNGLIFQDYSDSAENGLDFNSSEASNLTRRPRLLVTLAEAEDALTAALPNDGSAGGLTTSAPHVPVTDEELSALAREVIADWRNAVGADAASILSDVNVVVADLPGLELGRAVGNTVMIDVTAAGFGWFIDETPTLHEEFLHSAHPAELSAVSGGIAENRFDLRTVLLHEFGHVLGLEHDVHGGMQRTLTLGTRRLLDVDSAESVDSASTGFAAVDAYFGQLSSVGLPVPLADGT